MKKQLILFFLILIAGIFLRFNNLSPFKIYPDSYQNLLVAQNILTYQSVTGYLGLHGMLYPDFFMWTRTGYALLILIGNFFTHDLSYAAQLVSLLAGILATPIAYFFIKKVWGSNNYALAGSLLIALSFNHVVWSGFIMTETTSILFMLLFLLSFFSRLKTKPTLLKDCLTGILFVCAVMTRYEYLIVLLPIIFLIFRTSKQPILRLSYLISAFVLTFTFVVVQLLPLDSVWSVIMEQQQDMMKLTGIIVALFICLFIGKKIINEVIPAKAGIQRIFWIPDQVRDDKINTLIIGIIWIFSGFILTQMIVGSNIHLFWNDLSAIRNFFRHDFLISIFTIVGITLLLNKKDHRPLAYFVLSSLIFLMIIYHRINPEMERYMTHLIPFLLIPASYGIISSLQKQTPSLRAKQSNLTLMGLPRRLRLLSMTTLLIVQIIISYQGLHASQDSSWFRISYEEKAAMIVGNHILKTCHSRVGGNPESHWIPDQVEDDNNCMIIVSQPEPYFYHLALSTQSITDSTPFIYIDTVKDTQKIIIVEDMGMHEYFPNFTKFLESNLKHSEKARFFVHENFHITDRIIKEKYPVIMYELTLGELKTKIKDKKF